MIKNKQTRRTIAIFFLLNFLSTMLPYNALYANNNGPDAPEASGFEPVNATDMVNLSSGDMAYVLPLLEVDGFPVTLSYHAGIPMDMDASWAGLGWNINTGSISRGVVSTPDDWNMGRSMKFTYYYYETETYTVNVGVGFGKAAEVGVGLSWGSNKSLTGSVSAAIGPISASIDTDGNYGVGLSTSVISNGLGFDGAFDKPGGTNSGSPFGGSLSISGNVKKSGISVGLSAGYSKGGLNAGLGVSISGSGVGAGFSIGGGSGEGKSKRSAGGGGSIGSFSAADMSVSSSGFYIPINIWIFNFGFGYQRQKIKYKKGLNRYGFGSFYQTGEVFNTELGERKDATDSNGTYYDSAFEDLQRRNFYGDIYDQELAQHEIDFIQDYRNSIEKINFTFAGYDSYGINASGISGNLSPIIGENSVLIGEGFEGKDTDDSNKKMKVFYHNSYDRETSQVTLKTNKSISDNNLYFAFDGQIMNYMSVGGYLGNFSSSTTALNLNDFARKSGSYKQRPKTGSFVEVFTNTQLDQNPGLMLKPNTVYNSNTNTTTSRVANLGYEKDGIGGYKITTPDGKVYHFGQPVYQYEKVEHNFIEIDKGLNISGLNSSSKREATPYATHWLLTAITGPDYVDTNGNSYPDNGDYGYWLRLEHGQWSNAYTWRTPYANSDLVGQDNSITSNKDYRRYSTYNENDVNKADAGHFLQGRKDLYYLDRIVSREQTAYFVKDIRKDGLGTDLDYNFSNAVNLSRLNAVLDKYKERYGVSSVQYVTLKNWRDNQISKLAIGTAGSTFVDENGNDEVILGEEYASYETEYLLRLDKIIIEKNKESNLNTISSSNALGGISASTKNAPYNTTLNGNNGTLFSKYIPNAAKSHRLHQANNVLDVNDDDVKNYDYSKALKVIKFSHSYDLAKQSPNSISPEKGRLTLEKVHFYGRGMKEGATESELYDYMPPYEFNYKKGIRKDGTEVVFSRNDSPDAIGKEKEFNKKDSWGFIAGESADGKTLADTWSLNSIKTPQGSTIDIAYEEDDYYVEAFSRRFWEDNLKFNVVKTVDSPVDEFEIHIKYDDGYVVRDRDKFTNYFKSDDKVFLDLWIGVTLHEGVTNSHDSRGKIDVFPKEEGLELKSLTDTEIVLKAIGNDINDCRNCGGKCKQSLPFSYFDISTFTSKPAWWSKRNWSYSDYYSNKERGQTPGDVSRGEPGHSIRYKLLATKSPSGNNGGGLKVAKITVNDEAGATYETTYDYRVPDFVNGGFTDKSSGITSFYPIYGTTFVPYQNELPGPGVMYEWVTMKARGYDATGKELPSESTRYHYYTLQPNFHIFDPGFTMKDNDGEVLFKATVNDINIPKEKIKAKDITIETNLAKIGQLISIEQFNAENQLLNKTTNEYTNKLGKYQETFTSMKSIYDYSYDEDNGNYYNRNLKRRALSKSTKIEGGKILNKVTSVTPYGTSSIEYLNQDPYLGSYRTSIKTKADGTKVKETKYPAYEKYIQMGSKINNPSYRNMLTQEAMNVTSVEVAPNNWRTTSAGVTTWNNDWVYRDKDGGELKPTADNEKIWRKHKSFVWKGAIDEYGTYGKLLNQNSFNWGVGATQTNTEWEEVSEIMRYSHYSVPIEARDINDNYASSKMDANFSKTIAGGNAQYTEMYYSGLEEYKSGREGEFLFENTQLSSEAHTGESAVVVRATSKAFKLHIDSREGSTLLGKKFRPGNYKVSYWLYTPDTESKDVPNANLIYGTQNIASQETVKAGNWTLVNHFITVVDNTSLDLYLTNEGLSTSGIIDDFRIHPVASSMNSYVYDKNTDELRFILDANNLATEFKYDKAGRLCKTFKEVLNQGINIGGFKLLKEYRYRYKNAPSNSGICGCCEDDGVVYVNDAPTAMSDNYHFKVVTNEALTLDVLANDYDPNSLDVLTIDKIVSLPSNGVVAINNNKIVYTPNANFYGQDSFTYSIKDNGTPAKSSNTATVNISLTEDTFFPLIKITDFVDVGHKACTTFKVTIAGGSGSFTYVWKKIDYNDNVVSTHTGSSDYYVCTSCSANEYYQISCTITDNISGKVKTVNSATGPCGGSMGDGPVLEEPK
ncbi:Ig-like domain-containing protein [Tenacibaculum sp. FZY0031]|uniref:Ig-like domain-containing protein n=1 Tax=Tenacibaculum sp. FZY0031 TaxID=3116648 RepID=UPI002ECB9650|nr:Ig-like domain-containing protein [Tenacibaculum sp. FZY0031]